MNNNILKNNDYAKFGYGIVLDGLPDIPEFHFFFRPQTRLSSNVIVIFLKSLNVWKDIACRDSLHESFNVSFPEPDTISLFCLLMYFLFILLPHFVLIMYVPIL